MSGLFCFTTYHMSDIYEVLKKLADQAGATHSRVPRGRLQPGKRSNSDFDGLFLFSKKELDKDQTNIFLNIFPFQRS